MKNILSKIWKFINSEFFGYALIALFIIILASQCKRNISLKKDNKKKEQNIAALNNEINLHKNKNGILVASIEGFIASERELKDLNTFLSEEVKNQKGKVLSLNQSIIQLNQDKKILNKFLDTYKTKYDSIFLANDSTYIIPWTLAYTYDSTNFDVFKGQTNFSINKSNLLHIKSELIERNSKINLVWGQKVEDGKLRVFIQSKYPGFSLESLSGVLIDPNTNNFIKTINNDKKHWFTGIGIGPTLNIGYDFKNETSPIVLGIGIHYNLYEW